MRPVGRFSPPHITPLTRARLLSQLAAAAIHLVAIACLAVLTSGAPPEHAPSVIVRPPPEPPVRLVFLPGTGEVGGGGGGGNRQPGPIRQAHAPGRDAVTLRVARKVVPASRVVDEQSREGAIVLDAKPLASGGAFQLGLPSGGVEFGTSLGPGTGGGVGTGAGSGIGSGVGPGLGPGAGGGTGDTVYRAGGAVTPPKVLGMVQPTYTDRALANRAQGSVELELIVDRTGRATRIRVVRSLDSDLDRQAIDAVARWRFEPGRLAGTPVDVLVTVILDFRIR